MKKIILASSSPRRKELLKSIVKEFQIVSSNVEENYPSSLDPFNVSLYLSFIKANDVFSKYPNDIVIGCDTTIVMNNKVIGKPNNKNHAKEMLTEFSNKMHYVVSAITILTSTQKYEINSINKVYFKNISSEDIDEYLSHDEYKDKAGSYAVQGIANKFIDHIDGEYEAIVGLPLMELKELLNKIK